MKNDNTFTFFNDPEDKTTLDLNSDKKHSLCSYKLNTFDWMNQLKYVDEENIPEFVEVRFKNTRKGFYKNPAKIRTNIGDAVVVESATGNDVGLISLCSNLANRQMFKKEISRDSEEILRLVRLASLKDIEQWKETRNIENETLLSARKYTRELGLEMKINDIEYQVGRKKATFYYTADGRVDFRELIKIFAKNFKIKVEMRQIGIRQEAGRIGGIGDCGRELCCSSWLTNFTSVPTVAAKQQNLYLNPSKLSGQCGRLKCCLNFELNCYLEALSNFPNENIILNTKKNKAKVFKSDILNGIMWFSYIDNDNDGTFPIHINKVKKIMKMNKKGIYPNDLSDFIQEDILQKKSEDEVDFFHFDK
ncbi:MAG: regulatory iron-sulfur-containing complex subunit RicT [Bacteroidota bacterium]|nr:regulatory iron-sulfur-containing complex subunit RicT [Bacteroidota bacterium]